MKISGYRIIKFSPPHDTFILVHVVTDTSLSGWGEITGSGNDQVTSLIASNALASMVGQNPLHIKERMSPFTRFQVPPVADRFTTTAWSGINQALWDITARAEQAPLHRLFGTAKSTSVPLYANLNRGLFGKRSPQAFARHAEEALKAGFSFAKATPFDEVTPPREDPSVLTPALARLDAIFSVANTRDIAIDCHWRFNIDLAHTLMGWLAGKGPLYWVEDLLEQNEPPTSVSEFRNHYPDVKWAGGEDEILPCSSTRLLEGPDRPDVFMPDIKHLCGLEAVRDLLLMARRQGASLSLHNPAGPIATAFSAHLCAAVNADEPLEYGFAAVKSRCRLSLPPEPIDNGTYTLSDAPGIGLSLSQDALNTYGTLVAEG